MYIQQQQKNITSFSENDLGAYVAGIIEGDGCFGKTALGITFHLKDEIAAKNLVKAIGFGQVYRRKSQAVVLRIASKAGLRRVLELTNGRFRGPYKLEQLRRYNYESRLSITLLPSEKSVTFNDAWLAGFFEADGFTNIKIRANRKSVVGYYSEVSIGVGQKDRLILDSIAALFETKKVTAVKSNATLKRIVYNGFEFVVTSQKGIPLWLDYFERFHLQGRKYFQILKVKRCYELILEKKHLTTNGLNEILILQKELREMILFN